MNVATRPPSNAAGPLTWEAGWPVPLQGPEVDADIVGLFFRGATIAMLAATYERTAEAIEAVLRAGTRDRRVLR